jgi:hypothetical protein
MEAEAICSDGDARFTPRKLPEKTLDNRKSNKINVGLVISRRIEERETWLLKL